MGQIMEVTEHFPEPLEGSLGDVLMMNFNPGYWPSHRVGERTRSLILELLDKPLFPEEIAERTCRSVRQVRRQINRLLSEGRVKRLGSGQIINLCVLQTSKETGHI